MPFDDFTLQTYREPEFRLSRGAHFTRDEGVCVLEAALERAGYPHQRVRDVEELPPQFSRVLCEYAMALNDELPEELRTLLLEPYIRRLFGTGSESELEEKRLEFIRKAVYRHILRGEPEQKKSYSLIWSAKSRIAITRATGNLRSKSWMKQ